MARAMRTQRQPNARHAPVRRRVEPTIISTRERRRVRALYKTVGLPIDKQVLTTTLSAAKAICQAWLDSPEGRVARQQRGTRSWVTRRRAPRSARQVARQVAHAQPPRWQGGSRWAIVRRAVKLRATAFYWLEVTMRSLCAPDGAYQMADLEAYAREFCADEWLAPDLLMP